MPVLPRFRRNDRRSCPSRERTRSSALALSLCASIFAASLTGCGDDESIRVYDAPKEPRAEQPPPSDPHAGMDMSGMSMGMGMPSTAPGTRIVAATIPVDDGAWFVKVSGPVRAVEPFVDDTEAFVASLELGGPNRIAWDAPDTWQSIAPGQFATAKWTLDEARQVILSVTHLAMRPFGERELLDNVNRWRRQVGLPPYGPEGLRSDVKTIAVGDATASIVDLAPEGGATPTDPNAGTAMGAGRTDSGTDTARSPESASSGGAGQSMQWTLPAGWSEVPGSGMGRVATFRADGDPPVEISVTKFPGDVGGPLANVNRWRRQVGLGPISSLDGAVEALAGGDREITFVDAAGEGSRILALLVPAPQETWFVKAQGAPERLGALEDAFRELARSIRFDGG